MSLQLNIFPVKDIIFGKSTSYNNKVVSINKKELEDLVLSDNRIKDVDFEIVHPNDKTRITTVRDQIEPRIKISGPGCVYPGISGRSVETVGSGITNVLKGMSIFEVSDTVYYEGGDGEIETYIDMFEPGSLYTPYGSLHNLCVSINAKDDLHIEDKNDSIHGSILKISDLIASTTINQNPDEIKIPDSVMIRPKLVAVFDNIKDTINIMTSVYPNNGVNAEKAYENANRQNERNSEELDRQREEIYNEFETAMGLLEERRRQGYEDNNNQENSANAAADIEEVKKRFANDICLLYTSPSPRD